MRREGLLEWGGVSEEGGLTRVGGVSEEGGVTGSLVSPSSSPCHVAHTSG